MGHTPSLWGGATTLCIYTTWSMPRYMMCCAPHAVASMQWYPYHGIAIHPTVYACIAYCIGLHALYPIGCIAGVLHRGHSLHPEGVA